MHLIRTTVTVNTFVVFSHPLLLRLTRWESDVNLMFFKLLIQIKLRGRENLNTEIKE